MVHNMHQQPQDTGIRQQAQLLHSADAQADVQPGHYGALQMRVFIDSFTQLQSRSNEEIKYSKLDIHFHGKEGVDAGGVTREWFQVLVRQMFNPEYGNFKLVEQRDSIMENKASRKKTYQKKGVLVVLWLGLPY